MAEYWLGAHPNFPSPVAGGSDLCSLLHAQPETFLGAAQSFRDLPFLLKVLDVQQMLSIQVHPSKEAAAQGYAEENAKGISLKAPNRNYRDQNHKPELMVALSDFWLLHGFKPEDELLRTFDLEPELNFLKQPFVSGGYRLLYQTVMNMNQQQVDAVLKPVIDRLLPLYRNDALKKDQAAFWAARAAETYGYEQHIDRGIFSIFLFNLVHLKEDEGIFQDHGVPHAYLEGRNVEVMANSDNVLRAGLTAKHVDVTELMKHVKFEATVPRVLNPPEHGHRVFRTPAKEFELHQYELSDAGITIPVATAEIWLLLEGCATLQVHQEEVKMNSGEAVFIVPGDAVHLMAHESINLFRVTVPQAENQEG
jgi:mannose-6-phosphate isomerase